MHLIKRSTLIAYWTAHPEVKGPLTAWVSSVKQAKWASMNDVMSQFSKAKVLNRDRVRFDICGGNYRLIAAFRFKTNGGGTVFVKFIGTHTEYDRIDALTVSQY
ncbi:MAG: type II toxin-antitoxin system HigB family toxin [Rhodospirillaceae bacterium]|nr:type II toxin-antitoxin system HigB family toxin [Rhodospirillaceae bacterium]MCY4312047.1 type II toxin-antitoxin system HigB family toxin [Rhodospirillaceae bacterium]